MGKDFDNGTSQDMLDLIRGEKSDFDAGQDAMNMLRRSLAEDMIIPAKIQQGIKGFARVHESNRYNHLQDLLNETGGKERLMKIFIKSAVRNYPAIEKESPAAAAVLDDVMTQINDQQPALVDKAIKEITPRTVKQGTQMTIDFPKNS